MRLNIFNGFLMKLFTVLLFVVGCSADPTFFDDTTGSLRWERLSAEERAALAPNQIFEAVIKGQKETIAKALEEEPRFLVEINAQGDTPLGLAIKLLELEIAQLLLAKMDVSQYFHVNLEGESYVFLASRQGYLPIIKDLADGYWDSQSRWQDYEFTHLDPQNVKGQRALHVAANSQVVEYLQTQYYRGLWEAPWWNFVLQRDLKGRNFLHQAAEDGRSEVLLWAVENFCGVSSWEQTGLWVQRQLAWLKTRTFRAAQTYVGGLGLGLDLPLNWQDEEGKTPLHLAAESKNLSALRAIGTCEWVDYDLTDIEENLALQSFLQGLNPHQKNLNQGIVEIIEFFISRQTRMRSWFVVRSDYINYQNKQGMSSMHYSARLQDARIYLLLEQSGGDPYRKDENGRRPIDIFNQTQRSGRQNPL